MLHTIKLLQANFTALVMNTFSAEGPSANGDLVSQPLIKKEKIEAQELDAQKQEIQAETSQQTNMELLKSVGTLKLGAKGKTVEALQKLLQTQYPLLKVDGDFGPATLSAVRVFQGNNNLSPDGEVGKQTKATIERVIMNRKTVRESIKDASPTNIFKEQSVSKQELEKQLEVTHGKLDALNTMMTSGAEISSAIEAYMNGGNRDQFISGKGGILGLIRKLTGQNEFDNELDLEDTIPDENRKNINDAVSTLLGGSDKKISSQTVKDITLVLSSLALSGGETVSVPLGHLFNKFASQLVNFGIDLKQANNLSAYIKQTGGSEAFDVDKQYVSDHGVDALESTIQLQHTLRSFGLSQGEIDAALAGEISETSTKIRTVVTTFLQNILGRDLDAITKGSFSMLEKSAYIPLAENVAIPGNTDVSMTETYLGGDPKYGAARKIVKKIYAAIESLDGSPKTLTSVMNEIDTRMQGISYLLGHQVNDYKGFRGGNDAQRDLITKSDNDLNAKVDYMDDLSDQAPSIETYAELSEDKESLQSYAVLNTVTSIENLLENFHANEYVTEKLLSLQEDDEEDTRTTSTAKIKEVLKDKQVQAYLTALSNGTFTEYRKNQIKPEAGLNNISRPANKHGLSVDKDSTGEEVLDEMKNNTMDGKYSVLSSIENTFLDHEVNTVSSQDIEYAIENHWEAVDIKELSGVVINTGRGKGTENDKVTTFADLAKERGDTFMFKTYIEKTLNYVDTDGNSHTDTYKYTLYFRPECKNPIIHSELIERDGEASQREQAPDFNTAVPGLMTSTIPVWMNLDLKGGNSTPPSEGENPDTKTEPPKTNTPETPVDPEIPTEQASTQVRDGVANDISNDVTTNTSGVVNTPEVPVDTTQAVLDNSGNGAL